VYASSHDGANICAVSRPRATPYVEYTQPEIGGEDRHEVYANARHIATFCPERVIALLEFVQAWDALDTYTPRTENMCWTGEEISRQERLRNDVLAKRRALDEA
jgi:hypothetical protein